MVRLYDQKTGTPVSQQSGPRFYKSPSSSSDEKETKKITSSTSPSSSFGKSTITSMQTEEKKPKKQYTFENVKEKITIWAISAKWPQIVERVSPFFNEVYLSKENWPIFYQLHEAMKKVENSDPQIKTKLEKWLYENASDEEKESLNYTWDEEKFKEFVKEASLTSPYIED